MARKTASSTPKAKVLRCMKGYEFQKIGRNRVALMHIGGGGGPGATFNCECSLSGGCKVTIDPEDPQSISCLESGCSGTCGWVISIPGIRGLTLTIRER
jgi:hypothetical protein